MLEAFQRVLETAASFAAALGLASLIWRVYLGTWGRRRNFRKRVSRLGTNAQLGFFSSVIGEPPAIRRGVQWKQSVYEADRPEQQVVRTGHENTYVDPYFYVQALTDEDETVVAFSVTTRDRRFRPRLVSPGTYYLGESRGMAKVLFGPEKQKRIFDVTLGKTRFAEVDHPGKATAVRGARRFSYHEVHSLGNPGNYQSYVFAVSDAGADAFGASVELLFESGHVTTWPFDPEEDIEGSPGLKRYREEARINTFCVIGPSLSPDEYPLTYGPDLDTVRTLVS